MSQYKVLVVDDEEDVLRSTEMLLNVLGFECVPLMDARKASEVAKRVHPDLILHDLRMNGVDVTDLAARLRQDKATAEIPLVFFSASPTIDEAASRADAWGTLRKPFTEQDLITLLNRVLGPREMTARVAARAVLGTQVHNLFHDYWNTFSSIQNYARVLKASGKLPAHEQELVRNLERTLRQLDDEGDVIQTAVYRMFDGPAKKDTPDPASNEAAP